MVRVLEHTGSALGSVVATTLALPRAATIADLATAYQRAVPAPDPAVVAATRFVVYAAGHVCAPGEAVGARETFAIARVPATADDSSRATGVRRLGATWWPAELEAALAAAQEAFAAEAATDSGDFAAVSLVGTDDGEGGCYFLSRLPPAEAPPGASPTYIACFKPRDEEPFAPHNPKGKVAPFGTLSSRIGVQSGEGWLREVCAFVLDHGVAGVPPTGVAEAWHHAFNSGVAGHHAAPKIGSLQAFVSDARGVGDVFRPDFDPVQAQAIALLDLRLLNMDRHGGNILLQSRYVMPAGAATAPGGRPRLFGPRPTLVQRLVPIDHGLALPSDLGVSRFDWSWFDWPQIAAPLVPALRDFVAAYDDAALETDIQLLRACFGPALREPCVMTLRITHAFIRAGVAAGMTLRDLAAAMSRPDDGVSQSRLELLVEAAVLAAHDVRRNPRISPVLRAHEAATGSAATERPGYAPPALGRRGDDAAAGSAPQAQAGSSGTAAKPAGPGGAADTVPLPSAIAHLSSTVSYDIDDAVAASATAPGAAAAPLDAAVRVAAEAAAKTASRFKPRARVKSRQLAQVAAMLPSHLVHLVGRRQGVVALCVCTATAAAHMAAALPLSPAAGSLRTPSDDASPSLTAAGSARKASRVHVDITPTVSATRGSVPVPAEVAADWAAIFALPAAAAAADDWCVTAVAVALLDDASADADAAARQLRTAVVTPAGDGVVLLGAREVVAAVSTAVARLVGSPVAALPALPLFLSLATAAAGTSTGAAATDVGMPLSPAPSPRCGTAADHSAGATVTPGAASGDGVAVSERSMASPLAPFSALSLHRVRSSLSSHASYERWLSLQGETMRLPRDGPTDGAAPHPLPVPLRVATLRGEEPPPLLTRSGALGSIAVTPAAPSLLRVPTFRIVDSPYQRGATGDGDGGKADSAVAPLPPTSTASAATAASRGGDGADAVHSAQDALRRRWYGESASVALASTAQPPITVAIQCDTTGAAEAVGAATVPVVDVAEMLRCSRAAAAGGAETAAAAHWLAGNVLGRWLPGGAGAAALDVDATTMGGGIGSIAEVATRSELRVSVVGSDGLMRLSSVAVTPLAGSDEDGESRPSMPATSPLMATLAWSTTGSDASPVGGEAPPPSPATSPLHLPSPASLPAAHGTGGHVAAELPVLPAIVASAAAAGPRSGKAASSTGTGHGLLARTASYAGHAHSLSGAGLPRVGALAAIPGVEGTPIVSPHTAASPLGRGTGASQSFGLRRQQSYHYAAGGGSSLHSGEVAVALVPVPEGAFADAGSVARGAAGPAGGSVAESPLGSSSPDSGGSGGGVGFAPRDGDAVAASLDTHALFARYLQQQVSWHVAGWARRHAAPSHAPRDAASTATAAPFK